MLWYTLQGPYWSASNEYQEKQTRAVVGQRSSPAGYILYCNIFIIKKFKMYNNNKTQTHHEFLLHLKYLSLEQLMFCNVLIQFWFCL